MRRHGLRTLGGIVCALGWLVAASVSRGQSMAAPTLSRDLIPPDLAADVRAHVDRLYSSNPDECLAAVKALGAMGPRAAPAAPFLANMLEGHFGSPHPNAAGQALREIGAGAVESLNLALLSGGSETRRRAAYVIGLIRDERSIEPLLSAFAAGLGGPAQLGALRRLGAPARERVFAALQSDDVNLRRVAARAIVAFSTMEIRHRFLGNDGGGSIPVPEGWRSLPVVDALLAALPDPDAQVRIEVLNSLAILGASCRDAQIPLSDSLRTALSDADPAVRRAALGVAVRTEGDGKIEVLAGLLNDADAAVRDGALQELGTIRNDRALDAIATATASTDDSIRRFAARVLGCSGQSRFLPLFQGLSEDRSDAVRVEAAVAWGKFRATQAEGQLLKMLDDPAAPVRVAAALALGRCGGKAAAEALMRLTKSDDPQIRFEAARALCERILDRRRESWSNRRNRRVTGNEHPWELRQGLLPLTDSRTDTFPYGRVGDWMATLFGEADPNLHAMAAEALMDVEGRLTPASEVVLAALQSSDADARWVAIEHLLARRWTPDKRFLEPLRQEAGRRADRVRLWGPMLVRMGETEDVVRRCVAIVGGHEPKVAGMAIEMLADVGDAGLDALFGVFDDPRKEVREIAARALASRSDHPRVAAFVRSAAESADPRRREAALRITGKSAVSKTGQTAPELLVAAWRQDITNPQDSNRRKLVALGGAATAAVLPLLGDGDRETRVAAVSVLGELGDRSAIPALAGMLKDEAAPVRAQAAAVLGNLSATEAAGALRGAVRDGESCVAEAAVTALSRISGMADPATVDALVGALGSEEWRLRRAAAEGLGGYREARVAAALARALKEDPHWSVRRAAAEALARAEGPVAVPALVAALDDPHWFVRSAVHRGLVALTRQDLPAEGPVWRTWWEQKTRGGD